MSNTSSIKFVPSEDELNNIWCSIVNKRQLASSSLDISVVAELSELFMSCFRNNTTLSLSNANLPSELKSGLIAFVESRLSEIQPTEKTFNWNVCVVVGNSHVKKSLEVITELELNGEQLEFDYDTFGKLRQQLASAIIAMEKHPPVL
ncbi:hypothetical protein KIN20_006263 [Parelaphostrongylus tenuis]|uniref:COMM domain-containing protein n=1 Tax=Parelaphostrongylus tenuis TaxID=148309 RepID=A0AAD5MK35_PARTN|nr:hypothetical protein KIN20_006263 [Parelaphostrongylus tenuis]